MPKTHFISEVNKLKRVEWALKFKDFTEEDFKSIFFLEMNH